MGKPKKKIWLSVSIFSFIVFAIYFVLDYLDLPSRIGSSIIHINIDILGIVVNTLVVLALYVISFFYIDNRQNEKDANSSSLAMDLLHKTYKECLLTLEQIDNREIVAKYIVPKVDFNKPYMENDVIAKIIAFSFPEYDTIIALACDGHICKQDIDDYLDIKQELRHVVNMRITFFDLIEPQTAEQEALYRDIEKRTQTLKKKLIDLLSGYGETVSTARP